MTNTPGYIDSGIHYPILQGSLILHVYKDLVAFVWSVRDPHLLVFNWKTGGQILKIASLPPSVCQGMHQLTIYRCPSHPLGVSQVSPSSMGAISCFHTVPMTTK